MTTSTNEKGRMCNGTSELLQPYLEVSTSNKIVDQGLYFRETLYPSLSTKFVFLIKYGFWMWVLSPLVLICSLFIYTFAPSKVFKNDFTQLFIMSLNRYLKRLFDILGAIIGLILSSGIFLIVPILIKLDSKGPVFYNQLRVGQNRRKKIRRNIRAVIHTERRNSDRRKNNIYGNPFYIHKFRTMREDAEKKCGPIWALKNDPRITTVGKVLRYTHIDEIPQLINILKGEMSFVGPRPERPYFVKQLVPEIPGYTERLNVKPGLTGLAQINYEYDYSIESVRNKLNYDIHYCQNGNLYSYFKILLKTISRMISGKIKT